MTRPDHQPEKSMALQQTIGRKAARREQARREGRHTVWFGFGMFGLVGWAVAVPILASVALGRWLDARYPTGPSWTMTGLLFGAVLGSANAWWWVRRTGARDDTRAGDKEERSDDD